MDNVKQDLETKFNTWFNDEVVDVLDSRVFSSFDIDDIRNHLFNAWMNGAYVLDEMITKRLNNENTLYNSFKL
jgi:hypothetical protein